MPIPDHDPHSRRRWIPRRQPLPEIFGDGAYRFDCRRAAPRIVDCGAHIGLSVLIASAYQGLTI